MLIWLPSCLLTLNVTPLVIIVLVLNNMTTGIVICFGNKDHDSKQFKKQENVLLVIAEL
jgi:hypothetical protein